MAEYVAIKDFKHPNERGKIVRTGDKVSLTGDHEKLYKGLGYVVVPVAATKRRPPRKANKGK